MVGISLAFKMNSKQRPSRKVGGLVSQVLSMGQVLVEEETLEVSQDQK